MKSSEIRNKFLKYFESKGHKILPGSSLVPSDPTVLITLAGMLQFKPIFLGLEKPPYRRAATVQKCIRLNDVQNVGKTKRHHTFFEMLGNFSFGDYFKKEAINFAWELLTKEFKLPVTRLKIAVYEKDDEAFEIWRRDLGLPAEIIYRLGEDNNFWSAGPTGPCGPCSEIYYDLGEEQGCGKPDCSPGCDCDRYLEIWNLVFIQYNRNEKGELIPLKQKGIDTGMGLERIAAVLQGVADNYETDLFQPIIGQIKQMAAGEIAPVSLKIVADHIRAVSHLISDGVYPSNTGRGYVLRRLIRRAAVHGRYLGIGKPFLYELSRKVAAEMRDAYPALGTNADEIARIIKDEEDNFFSTLEQGIKYFDAVVSKLEKGGTVNGLDAFKLHDTYGFPIELTFELAEKRGFKVQVEEYDREMEKQKERARRAGLSAAKKIDFGALNLDQINRTDFIGYEKHSFEAKVIALFPEKNLVVLDKSAFYGESGGQVGDTGILSWDGKDRLVINTLISPGGIILHAVEDLKELKINAKISGTIDIAKRKATEAHHTATHLLHKALREVIGEQARQAGSYVGPDKLRFDFNASRALTDDEIGKIEQRVNQKIKEKLKVEVLQKTYQEALELGAMALFGEKYGERVRVLKIGDYSLELCGGTHVRSSADILFLKIVSESALGSGIRRIEAIAGQAAKVGVVFKAKSMHDEVAELIRKYRLLQSDKEELGGTKSLETNIFEIEVTELDRLGKAIDNQDSVNVNQFLDHLSGRVDWLKERIIRVEGEINDLKLNAAMEEASAFAKEAIDLNGRMILLKQVNGLSMEMLRAIAEKLQSQPKPSILLLVSTLSGRFIFLTAVSPVIADQQFSAKAVAAVFSGVAGGKGGGKDVKAEGGGKDIAKIEPAIAAVAKYLGL